MKKSILGLSIVCVIILVLALVNRSSRPNHNYLGKLDPEIRDLIIKVLDVQYKEKLDFTYEEVFARSYIGEAHKFRLEFADFAPYVFFNDEDVQVAYNIDNDVVRVTIHIEDMEGSYFQIIYFEKVDDKYYVNGIEKDI